MVQALISELKARSGSFDYPIKTIYFGGGTPSLLSLDQINSIMNAVQSNFQITENMEITLEANPDDLHKSYLNGLKTAGINRLSIGVQSFQDTTLAWMNRAHDVSLSYQSIQDAQDAGFDQISIDLIYGSPGLGSKLWEENLRTAIEFGVGHISSYCLTVEEGTALGHWVKQGKARPVDEQAASEQFLQMCAILIDAGYLHYEISNFSLPGAEAKHNSNYWRGHPYLGIGPSAHSYQNNMRFWNLANNQKYLDKISSGEVPYTVETLSEADRYNEYVMTGLRTSWGVNLDLMKAISSTYSDHFTAEIRKHINAGHVVENDKIYTLSISGKLLADGIASDLFWTS